MELKNFAKKAFVAALLGSITVASLTACSSDKSTSSPSMSKSSGSSSVRGKDSTYSTK